MSRAEKMAAVSKSEYGKRYSSLSDGEILQAWATTSPQDTDRYFIHREILTARPQITSSLLPNHKKKHKFLRADEYLIAEHKEGFWLGGGFATYKSMSRYMLLVLLPLMGGFALSTLLEFLGPPYVPGSDNSWLFTISFCSGFFGFMLLIAWIGDFLTRSYAFITNQRIGYYRTILLIFKLSPKWLDLTEGHIISGPQQYWDGIGDIGTQKEALQKGHIGLRLDRYGSTHQRLNLILNPGTIIYLLESLQLVSSQTRAVIYNGPIMFPNLSNDALLVKHRFEGSHFQDLANFFRTINQGEILQSKNIAYMGKTNMERLADFFASPEAVPPPGTQPNAPSPFDAPSLNNSNNPNSPNNSEIVVAYFPGSPRGRRKWPLIGLTTHGIKCYKRGGKLKAEYLWSDPNLIIGISRFSVNIIYQQKKDPNSYWGGTHKLKKLANIYWDIVDAPIIDIFEAVGGKQIYSSTMDNFSDRGGFWMWIPPI